MQDCDISSANALEIPQSCIKPLVNITLLSDLIHRQIGEKADKIIYWSPELLVALAPCLGCLINMVKPSPTWNLIGVTSG